MTIMDYWEECIAEALDEAGVAATQQQIGIIAAAAEAAHDGYSMAYGLDVADSNLMAEQNRESAALERELRRERAKVTCADCKGSGRIITQGPYHSSDTECSKCRGSGKVDP